MFILSLVLLAVAIGAAVAAALLHSGTAALVGGACVVFAFLAGLIASVSQVPTRNVGIVTEFSKPTGRTTGAGIQWHAPWQSIDDWDASSQTYAHLGDRCVWVAIAAQRKACIPVQIEWSSKAEQAPENWATYREVDGLSRFEVFVARRVEPQITAAVTAVFAPFDPLSTVDPKSGQAPAPNLNAVYADPLRKAIEAGIGQDVTVKSIAFEAPRYDEPTTNAIAAYGQKILEQRNLAIDEANAQARKRISLTNASVDTVTRCLEIAEKLGKEPGLCMAAPAAVRNVG